MSTKYEVPHCATSSILPSPQVFICGNYCIVTQNLIIFLGISIYFTPAAHVIDLESLI
jgi:hypothetical protein